MTLVTYGSMINSVSRAAERLADRGIQATVLRILTLDELPVEEMLGQMTDKILVIEEACTGSGIREAFAWRLKELSPEKRVYGMDLGKDFVPHGSQDKLYAYCGLDEASIIKKAEEVLEI